MPEGDTSSKTTAAVITLDDGRINSKVSWGDLKLFIESKVKEFKNGLIKETDEEKEERLRRYHHILKDFTSENNNRVKKAAHQRVKELNEFAEKNEKKYDEFMQLRAQICNLLITSIDPKGEAHTIVRE